MKLTRFAAPAETPVTLAEAKAHLRVDGTDDDAMVQIYLDAAVSMLDGAEGTLGRCLVTQTWDYTLDGFDGEIRLPLLDVSSVVSVSYRDTNGDTQVVNAADYVVSDNRIQSKTGWPATDGYAGAVTVRFVAGYGAASAVPAAIKSALLLIIGDLHANREATSSEEKYALPAAAALLRPYRNWRV